MKNKKINHPKLFTNILNINKDILEVEYKCNEFNDLGKRIIKREFLNLKECLVDSDDDMQNILKKINNIQLLKVENYIKTQEKVLLFHEKKNNKDSIRVVKESIKMMKIFKGEFLNYGF
jgi:hypothetical protein